MQTCIMYVVVQNYIDPKQYIDDINNPHFGKCTLKFFFHISMIHFNTQQY